MSEQVRENAAPDAAPDRPGRPRPGDDPSDFERHLAERTKVPPHRLTEYLGMPEDALKRELHTVARILKRFAEAVVDCMDDPEKGSGFLKELDLRAISRDHEWRAIFSTFRAHASGYEDQKRVILIKYLQYLSFRKRLLAFIYTKKAGLAETDELHDLTLFPSGGPGARERVRVPGDRFTRLALGESVCVALPPAGKVEIMLAGHLFRLIGTRVPCLLDQRGTMYFLENGRTMVGRHPESDVEVDSEYRDVSRAHMIVEWREGAHEVTITDLSSRGTFVAAEHVKPALVRDGGGAR